jgi:hypothetical protein
MLKGWHGIKLIWFLSHYCLMTPLNEGHNLDHFLIIMINISIYLKLILLEFNL